MPLFFGGEKIADTELLPHQQRVVDKIQNQSGLLVYHKPGSGKTNSALSSMKKLNKPSTVITPAALKSNFIQEQDKHLDTKLPMDMDTLENVARKQTGKKNPVLVVDEAHRARTPGSKTLSALKSLSSDAEKTMLLTGTPMVNGPSDIAPLINIVSKEKLLPEAKDEFEKKYVYNKKINPSFLQRLKGIKPGEKQVVNKHETENLRNIFSKWVDYEPGSKEGFPSVEEQDIEVPMSEKQLAIYDSLMGTAPPWVAAKVKSNLPPNKQESAQLNAYLTAARQTSNSPHGYTTEEVDSPKIQRAYEELKKILDVDPQNKGVVYSNFLESGLSPYGELLKKENIPFGEISGRVPQATRDQHVKDYNEGKLRALLLSPAAQQGLNLKGSTLMQLLDPAWNEPSLDQAKARAIRYQSHAHLPEEKRKVLVQKFLATRPKSLLQRMGVADKEYAVDEYLKNLSRNKAELVGQFEDLMRPQEKTAVKAEDKVKQFNETKDYNLVLKNVSSPKFRKLLIQASDDPRFHNFLNNAGKHFSGREKEKHQVESSSKKSTVYDVKLHKDGSYTCSCPNYLYRRGPDNGECKHIVGIKGQVKTAAAKIEEPFQQTLQTRCSAACLKMVLKYYGVDKDETVLADLIGIDRQGAEGDKIVKAAKKLNFEAEWKQLSPSEAIKLLNDGVPIIADMKSWNYPQPGRYHWVVIEDIDLKNNKVHIADPNTPGNRRVITYKELDERWRSKNMYTGKDMIRAGVIISRPQKVAEEEKSFLQKSAPYLAAAGAGLGTYGLLRRFSPSANKGLTALQNAMKNKKLNIQVDKAHKLHKPIFGMNPVDRATKNVPSNVGVLNHSTSTRALPSEVQINTELASAMDNKVTFDKIMNQGVGYGPTKADSPTAKGTEYFHDALRQVGGDVSKLKQKYPEFVMKPATGSLGQVENLITNTEHPMFQKIMKDPNMQSKYLIQEKLPIDKEYRVHTLNGVPFSVMNRRIENSTARKLWEKATGSSGGGAFIPTLGKDRRDLKDFVSKSHEHLQPAFEQGHNLHSAYDVVKLKDGSFKLIEANPTPGTLMNPIVNRKLNRMATGRWGKDVATAGGIGAGAATLGASKLLNDSE